MTEQYIDVPIFTTIQEITANNYSLSATQYKSLRIPNTNFLTVADFLDRDLFRSDLGMEVGSENYSKRH